MNRIIIFLERNVWFIDLGEKSELLRFFYSTYQFWVNTKLFPFRGPWRKKWKNTLFWCSNLIYMVVIVDRCIEWWFYVKMCFKYWFHAINGCNYLPKNCFIYIIFILNAKYFPKLGNWHIWNIWFYVPHSNPFQKIYLLAVFCPELIF